VHSSDLKTVDSLFTILHGSNDPTQEQMTIHKTDNKHKKHD